jgi:hypothetical protein
MGSSLYVTKEVIIWPSVFVRFRAPLHESLRKNNGKVLSVLGKTQKKTPNSKLVEIPNINMPHIESFDKFIQPLADFLERIVSKVKLQNKNSTDESKFILINKTIHYEYRKYNKRSTSNFR